VGLKTLFSAIVSMQFDGFFAAKRAGEYDVMTYSLLTVAAIVDDFTLLDKLAEAAMNIIPLRSLRMQEKNPLFFLFLFVD
jgi:hypothetical protein